MCVYILLFFVVFLCLHLFTCTFFILPHSLCFFKCLFSISVSASFPFQSVHFSTGPLCGYNQTSPFLFTFQHPLNIPGISCPFSFNHVYLAHSPNFCLFKSYLSFKNRSNAIFSPQNFCFLAYLWYLTVDGLKDPFTLQ